MPIPGSPVTEAIAPLPRRPGRAAAQCGELLLAADERQLRACRGFCAGAHDAEGAHGFARPLQLEVAECIELEQPADLVRRRPPDHQIAHRLQARGNVAGVAERVGEDVRRRVAGRDHDRARVDGNARGELDSVRSGDLGAVVGERVVDREGRADGALGVVLVRHGRAEERQDAVAGQLRDRSAEALDLLAHQPCHVVEEEPRPLDAELPGNRRRAGDSATRTETIRRSPVALPGSAALTRSEGMVRARRTSRWTGAGAEAVVPEAKAQGWLPGAGSPPPAHAVACPVRSRARTTSVSLVLR